MAYLPQYVGLTLNIIIIIIIIIMEENDYIRETIFELLEFPEVQIYMVEPDFSYNSCLANSDYFIDKFGSSAYFVNSLWKEEVDKRNKELNSY